MNRESEARTLTSRVLDLISPDQGEVALKGTSSALTRFANNAVHQNVSEANTQLYVRVFQGARAGSAITNRLDEASLKSAVKRARDLADMSADDPHFPGLARHGSAAALDAVDPAVAEQPPEARAQAVGEVCRTAAAAGLRAAGAYRVATEQRAVANSEGTFAYHAGTQVDFQTVVMGDGSSGWAQASHWKVGEVPVAALGEEAIRKALDGKNRQPIEPEPYAVVLDPYATADLLSMLNLVGMSAQAIIEGQSWMVDRIGTKAMNEQVNIWDDGLDPRGLPLPFDYEGVPKQRVDIVSEGVVRGPVYDRKTAKRLGDSSTGHAMSPFLPQIARGYGPLALNLVMLPGEATTEELIASTEQGLYITRFHYTRAVHPRDCVVTGMTRDGVFMIEQGKLTYPVKDLRFTQSYVEALRDVEAVGSETRLLIEDFLGLTARAPALKIKNFRFTGSTV